MKEGKREGRRWREGERKGKEFPKLKLFTHWFSTF